MSSKLLTVIALPFIAGLFFLSTASFIRFKASLSPVEAGFLNLAPERLKLIERHPVSISDSIESPIEIPAPAPEVRAQEKPPLKTVPEEKKVSLILIRDGERLTIINNLVLKEGDRFGESKVITIDKDRVLIREKGGGRRWLKLEQ